MAAVKPADCLWSEGSPLLFVVSPSLMPGKPPLTDALGLMELPCQELSQPGIGLRYHPCQKDTVYKLPPEACVSTLALGLITRSGLWFLKDQEKPVLSGLGLEALFFAQEAESIAGGVLAH